MTSSHGDLRVVKMRKLNCKLVNLFEITGKDKHKCWGEAVTKIFPFLLGSFGMGHLKILSVSTSLNQDINFDFVWKKNLIPLTQYCLIFLS